MRCLRCLFLLLPRLRPNHPEGVIHAFDASFPQSVAGARAVLLRPWFHLNADYFCILGLASRAGPIKTNANHLPVNRAEEGRVGFNFAFRLLLFTLLDDGGGTFWRLSSCWASVGKDLFQSTTKTHGGHMLSVRKIRSFWKWPWK